jgi:hypothetical protein
MEYFRRIIIACLKTIKKGWFYDYMNYIIENANILKESDLLTTSMVVKENQIAYLSNNIKKYSFMKMNAEPYIMTPTFVLFDSLHDLKTNSFKQKKEYFLENFIRQGCTTILTFVDVKYESELSTRLKSIKIELINSPIDYLIGVKVPLSLLNPSFIRKCKKEKIPAIFIDLQEKDDLTNVPWGWIRDAMFPYNSPLIPYISETDNRNMKQLMSDWKNEMAKQKIPNLETPLAEKVPLPIQALSKIGIFPHKSSIIQGGELSYNLYMKNREIKNIDVSSLFHYHNDKLLITVHKGVVIRAAETGFLFRSGFGEHLSVKMPSFFSIP